MKHSTNRKWFVVTPPAAIVDDAAFVTAAIDTNGYDQLTIIAILGAIDVAFDSMSVRSSNAANMGSPTTLITGGDGESGTFLLPAHATADNTILQFNVDLKGKQRYIDFEATGGDGSAGTYMTVIAELTRGKRQGGSAADRGIFLEVNI